MAEKKYRFSPILTEENLMRALNYIADEVLKLDKNVLGKELPIDTLTIFTHYEDEHTFLVRLVHSYGPTSKYSHGATLYVEPEKSKIENQDIRYLGVRAPDTSRTQVGYGDFPVADLNAAYRQYSSSRFIKKVQSGAGQDLLEISHPDFDVLAYMVEH